MLKSKGIVWNRHQIGECFRTIGGTLFYLDKLEKKYSLYQNIKKLFFHHFGELREEYDFLFRSLFNRSPIYKRVVQLLAKKTKGLTREEIKSALKIPTGALLSEVLQNLISCDFIRAYRHFDKKERGRLYQLTDLYTLFYLHQVANTDEQDNE